MNLALIGYGNMGKEIEKIARNRGHSITLIHPSNENHSLRQITEESLDTVDVCIDFTNPGAVVENAKKIASLKKNTVIGTTGWYGQMATVREMIEKSGTGCIWSGNFSLGVNAFFEMARNACETMNKLEEYDVFVHEMHHSNKKDSPSGTALMIADIVLDATKRKKKMATGELRGAIGPEELHVSSTRGGSAPGTHTLWFDSPADTIELRHTARNRSGFAQGAVRAAEWIHNKKGFYNIHDMMVEIKGGR